VKKGKKRVFRQIELCKFTRKVLGYAGLQNTSVYELARRALQARGHQKPPNVSDRTFVESKADVIREILGMPSLHQVSAPPRQPDYEQANSDSFLESYEWRRLRMQALKKYGARCQCCGATPADGAKMNVDHIKPRRIFPQLALDLTNLQVLCAECNHGKGNWDMTDWRGETSGVI
jgi:5-methylcytosine-specific restriction endonuclease McrA